MSEQIAYLINLHKEGKISDSALDKAWNAIQEPSKKQRKRQASKYKDDYDKVINVLKQRHSKELVSEKQELNLVDKPKCGYFKSYEISADKYKDPNKLFRDKKSIITQQIDKELKELGGLKFQLGLTIIFYKDDDAEKKS